MAEVGKGGTAVLDTRPEGSGGRSGNTGTEKQRESKEHRADSQGDQQDPRKARLISAIDETKSEGGRFRGLRKLAFWKDENKSSRSNEPQIPGDDLIPDSRVRTGRDTSALTERQSQVDTPPPPRPDDTTTEPPAGERRKGRFDVALVDVKGRGNLDVLQSSAILAADSQVREEMSGWIANRKIRQPTSPGENDTRTFLKKVKDRTVMTGDLALAFGKEFAHHPPSTLRKLFQNSMVQGAVREKATLTAIEQRRILGLNNPTDELVKGIKDKADDVFSADQKKRTRIRRTGVGAKDMLSRAIIHGTELDKIRNEVAQALVVAQEAIVNPDIKLTARQQELIDKDLLQMYIDDRSGQMDEHRAMIESAGLDGSDFGLTEITGEERTKLMGAMEGWIKDDFYGKFKGVDAELRMLQTLQELGLKSDLSAQSINGLKDMVHLISQEFKTTHPHLDGMAAVKISQEGMITDAIAMFVADRDDDIRFQKGELTDKTVAEIDGKLGKEVERVVNKFKKNNMTPAEMAADGSIAQAEMFSLMPTVKDSLRALGIAFTFTAAMRGADFATKFVRAGGLVGVPSLAAMRAAARAGRSAEIGLANSRTKIALGEEFRGKLGEIAQAPVQDITQYTDNLTQTADSLRKLEHITSDENRRGAIGEALVLIASVDARNSADDQSDFSLWKTDQRRGYHRAKVPMFQAHADALNALSEHASDADIRAIAGAFGIGLPDGGDTRANIDAIRGTLSSALQLNILNGNAVEDALIHILQEQGSGGQVIEGAVRDQARKALGAQEIDQDKTHAAAVKAGERYKRNRQIIAAVTAAVAGEGAAYIMGDIMGDVRDAMSSALSHGGGQPEQFIPAGGTSGSAGEAASQQSSGSGGYVLDSYTTPIKEPTGAGTHLPTDTGTQQGGEGYVLTSHDTPTGTIPNPEEKLNLNALPNEYTEVNPQVPLPIINSGTAVARLAPLERYFASGNVPKGLEHSGGGHAITGSEIFGEHGLLSQLHTKAEVEYQQGPAAQDLHTLLSDHGNSLIVKQMGGKDINYIDFQVKGPDGNVYQVLVHARHDSDGNAFVELPLTDKSSIVSEALTLQSGMKINAEAFTDLAVNKGALSHLAQELTREGTLHNGNGDIAVAEHPDLGGNKVFNADVSAARFADGKITIESTIPGDEDALQHLARETAESVERAVSSQTSGGQSAGAEVTQMPKFTNEGYSVPEFRGNSEVWGAHGIFEKLHTNVDSVDFVRGPAEQALHTRLADNGHTLVLEQVGGKDLNTIGVEVRAKNGALVRVLLEAQTDKKGDAFVRIPLDNDSPLAGEMLAVQGGREINGIQFADLFVNHRALSHLSEELTREGTLHNGNGDISVAEHPNLDGDKVFNGDIMAGKLTEKGGKTNLEVYASARGDETALQNVNQIPANGEPVATTLPQSGTRPSDGNPNPPDNGTHPQGGVPDRGTPNPRGDRNSNLPEAGTSTTETQSVADFGPVGIEGLRVEHGQLIDISSGKTVMSEVEFKKISGYLGEHVHIIDKADGDPIKIDVGINAKGGLEIVNAQTHEVLLNDLKLNFQLEKDGVHMIIDSESRTYTSSVSVDDPRHWALTLRIDEQAPLKNNKPFDLTELFKQTEWDLKHSTVQMGNVNVRGLEPVYNPAHTEIVGYGMDGHAFISEARFKEISDMVSQHFDVVDKATKTHIQTTFEYDFASNQFKVVDPKGNELLGIGFTKNAKGDIVANYTTERGIYGSTDWLHKSVVFYVEPGARPQTKTIDLTELVHDMESPTGPEAQIGNLKVHGLEAVQGKGLEMVNGDVLLSDKSYERLNEIFGRHLIFEDSQGKFAATAVYDPVDNVFKVYGRNAGANATPLFDLGVRAGKGGTVGVYWNEAKGVVIQRSGNHGDVITVKVEGDAPAESGGANFSIPELEQFAHKLEGGLVGGDSKVPAVDTDATGATPVSEFISINPTSRALTRFDFADARLDSHGTLIGQYGKMDAETLKENISYLTQLKVSVGDKVVPARFIFDGKNGFVLIADGQRAAVTITNGADGPILHWGPLADSQTLVHNEGTSFSFTSTPGNGPSEMPLFSEFLPEAKFPEMMVEVTPKDVTLITPTDHQITLAGVTIDAEGELIGARGGEPLLSPTQLNELLSSKQFAFLAIANRVLQYDPSNGGFTYNYEGKSGELFFTVDNNGNVKWNFGKGGKGGNNGAGSGDLPDKKAPVSKGQGQKGSAGDQTPDTQQGTQQGSQQGNRQGGDSNQGAGDQGGTRVPRDVPVRTNGETKHPGAARLIGDVVTSEPYGVAAGLGLLGGVVRGAYQGTRPGRRLGRSVPIRAVAGGLTAGVSVLAEEGIRYRRRRRGAGRRPGGGPGPGRGDDDAEAAFGYRPPDGGRRRRRGLDHIPEEFRDFGSVEGLLTDFEHVSSFLDGEQMAFVIREGSDISPDAFRGRMTLMGTALENGIIEPVSKRQNPVRIFNKEYRRLGRPEVPERRLDAIRGILINLNEGLADPDLAFEVRGQQARLRYGRGAMRVLIDMARSQDPNMEAVFQDIGSTDEDVWRNALRYFGRRLINPENTREYIPFTPGAAEANDTGGFNVGATRGDAQEVGGNEAGGPRYGLVDADNTFGRLNMRFEGRDDYTQTREELQRHYINMGRGLESEILEPVAESIPLGNDQLLFVTEYERRNLPDRLRGRLNILAQNIDALNYGLNARATYTQGRETVRLRFSPQAMVGLIGIAQNAHYQLFQELQSEDEGVRNGALRFIARNLFDPDSLAYQLAGEAPMPDRTRRPRETDETSHRRRRRRQSWLTTGGHRVVLRAEGPQPRRVNNGSTGPLPGGIPIPDTSGEFRVRPAEASAQVLADASRRETETARQNRETELRGDIQLLNDTTASSSARADAADRILSGYGISISSNVEDRAVIDLGLGYRAAVLGFNSSGPADVDQIFDQHLANYSDLGLDQVANLRRTWHGLHRQLRTLVGDQGFLPEVAFADMVAIIRDPNDTSPLANDLRNFIRVNPLRGHGQLVRFVERLVENHPLSDLANGGESAAGGQQENNGRPAAAETGQERGSESLRDEHWVELRGAAERGEIDAIDELQRRYRTMLGNPSPPDVAPEQYVTAVNYLEERIGLEPREGANQILVTDLGRAYYQNYVDFVDDGSSTDIQFFNRFVNTTPITMSHGGMTDTVLLAGEERDDVESVWNSFNTQLRELTEGDSLGQVRIGTFALSELARLMLSRDDKEDELVRSLHNYSSWAYAPLRPQILHEFLSRINNTTF
jgi:hypothetical protein